MILDYAADWDLRTLSVRGLAARMRVSDASIHYHFGSREQLLAALVDALTSDFEPPAGQADWRAWLREFAHRARRSLRAHPGAADYMLLAGPVAGRQYAIIERALEMLNRGGLEAREAWLIYATTMSYVLRQVQSEEAHTAMATPARRTDQRMAAALDAPEAQPSPLLKAVVDKAWLADFDRLFDYGLEALLRGFGPQDGD
ncbi:MAG: TetR/AcrR family transcriptional regulator C-terminal domain-containing protein [Phenylobacterium sp.]